MAVRHQKSSVVDGFTTVKVAERALSASRRRGAPAKRAPSMPKPAEPPVRKEDKRASRIGHTIEPSRHDITCYECGFKFLLTGRIKSTYCPKCRCTLEAGEYAIDGEWADTVKTIGTVHINAGGVVKGGRIAAQDIILAGRIDGGKVKVFNRLEACAAASFEPEAVEATDLIVRNDAQLCLAGKLTFRNVEIAGNLKARVLATGLITVRAGGLLQGRVQGHHLVVEDGGGLKAQIEITAPGRTGGDSEGEPHDTERRIGTGA